MFSGLIVYRGAVTALEALPDGGATLRVSCEGVSTEAVAPKDSIAINGVCLTATDVDGSVVRFDVVPETLARSTLGTLRHDDLVNVEYALRLGDRIGGHLVYGHVDAVARVLAQSAEGQGRRLRVETPNALEPTIAEKGFVAVDGVSLTVAAVGDGWFEIALVPETLSRTTLGERAAGDAVNVEADPIARYAAHAMRTPVGGGSA